MNDTYSPVPELNLLKQLETASEGRHVVENPEFLSLFLGLAMISGLCAG